MSTLIINGSPKGKNGNTEVFIRQFLKGAKLECEVRYVHKEASEELATHIRSFDTTLFFMPLYVFAMPGKVMKLFEKMEPSVGKRFGFVLQYGFVEGHHAENVEKQFKSFTAQMQSEYIGTVIKGEAAGVSMVPESMNKKLFSKLRELGEHYAKTGMFKESVMAALLEPYDLSKRRAAIYQAVSNTGVNDIMWNGMLRKNKALDKGRDRPFID